jgi:hypothetical protein
MNEKTTTLLVETAPGLVGDVAEWIIDTAPKPQPALALGAALAAVGTIKGHRVQTDTGLRTNIFALGLGDSGCGKDHPKKMINLLFKESAIEKHLTGVPTSDSGLLRVLAEKGRALINWDEIGHAMIAITDPRGSSHEKKILGLMLSIWSSSNDIFMGKEYADTKLKDSFTINQPHLSIWGNTTPQRFYDALTNSHAVDGFLPRWLVFPISDPDVQFRKTGVHQSAPEELVKRVIDICSMTTNSDPRGNIDEKTEIRPKIVPHCPSTLGRIEEIRDEYEAKKIKERKSGSGLDSVYARGFEHVMKIALTVCDEDMISEDHLEWAHFLVMSSLEYSCTNFTKNSHENEFSKQMAKVRDYIVKHGPVSRGRLYRKFRLPPRTSSDIINSLIESKEIVEYGDNDSAGRPLKIYAAHLVA